MRAKLKWQWKDNIEQNRWANMELSDLKQMSAIQYKDRSSRQKIGISSVKYNLLNNTLPENGIGACQLREDAEANYRLAMRSAKLYEKGNTFDPIRCTDIPRLRIVSGKSDGAFKTDQSWEESKQSTIKHISAKLRESAKEVAAITGAAPPIQRVEQLETKSNWIRHF